MRYHRLVDRRLPVLLALVLLAGCEGAGPARDVEQIYAIVRIAVDPITIIGQLFRDAPTVGSAYEGGFDTLSCDGDLSLAFRFTGQGFTEPRGLGELSFLAVTPIGTSDLCAGHGEAEVQPLAYVPGTREPLVTGPGWMDGATIDARIPLGRFPGLELFPEWWTANARGQEVGVELDDAHRYELREGEVGTVWPARQLGSFPVPETAGYPAGSTPFDVLIGLELQPDIDVDVDGLEVFRDTDGDGLVDHCVDGDGSVIEGRDCIFSPGMVDGYELRIRFRLARLDRIDL